MARLPQTLSTGDVAKVLRVTPRAVQRWVREERLSAINVGTEDRPRLRLSSVAVAAFLERRGQNPRERLRDVLGDFERP